MTDLDLQKKGIMLQNQNNGPIIQKQLTPDEINTSIKPSVSTLNGAQNPEEAFLKSE